MIRATPVAGTASSAPVADLPLRVRESTSIGAAQ